MDAGDCEGRMLDAAGMQVPGSIRRRHMAKRRDNGEAGKAHARPDPPWLRNSIVAEQREDVRR